MEISRSAPEVVNFIYGKKDFSREAGLTLNMKLLLENRQARFEYEPIEKFVAGIQLTGGEVKMLRQKKGSLAGAFVRVIGSELHLLNAQIPPYPYARNEDYEPTRTRKLLMRKSELIKLQEAQKQKGLTLIPWMIGLNGKFIKVEVAIARGKSTTDKRREIRERDIARDTARELKSKGY